MNNSLSNADIESLINDNDNDNDVETGRVHTATQLPQQDVSFFGNIPVHVTLEVASTEVTLKELMDVDINSVIVLDKLAGQPLDVKVNGILFAKAEVVVMAGNYSLRIVELSGTSLNELAR